MTSLVYRAGDALALAVVLAVGGMSPGRALSASIAIMFIVGAARVREKQPERERKNPVTLLVVTGFIFGLGYAALWLDYFTFSF